MATPTAAMWTSTFVSLLFVGQAHAGACCVGRTSAQGAWLSPCEHAGVALTTSVATDLLRWRGDGAVDTSSLDATDAELSLAGAYRFDRTWQVGAVVPIRGAWRSAGTLETWGGGLGDPGLAMRVDPFEEPVRGAAPALPVPAFTATVSLPLGVSDHDAADPLLADVTGAGAVVGSVGAQLGRSSDRVPWSVGIGVTGEAGEGHRGLGGDAYAQVGWSVHPRWTLSGTVSHREMFRGTEAPTARTAETRAGASVAYGVPLRLRVWLSLDSGVPMQGLGVDLPVSTRGALGVLFLR